MRLFVYSFNKVSQKVTDGSLPKSGEKTAHGTTTKRLNFGEAPGTDSNHHQILKLYTVPGQAFTKFLPNPSLTSADFDKDKQE